MMDHPFRLCMCCSVVGAVAAVVGIYRGVDVRPRLVGFHLTEVNSLRERLR
jgi:hypothetical protein